MQHGEAATGVLEGLRGPVALGGGEDTAREAEPGHSDRWHGRDKWARKVTNGVMAEPRPTKGRLPQAQNEGRRERFRSRSLGAARVGGAPDRARPSLRPASTSGGLAVCGIPVGWAGREFAATGP